MAAAVILVCVEMLVVNVGTYFAKKKLLNIARTVQNLQHVLIFKMAYGSHRRLGLVPVIFDNAL